MATETFRSTPMLYPAKTVKPVNKEKMAMARDLQKTLGTSNKISSSVFSDSDTDGNTSSPPVSDDDSDNSRDSLIRNEVYDADNSADELSDDGKSWGSGKVPRLLRRRLPDVYRPNGMSRVRAAKNLFIAKNEVTFFQKERNKAVNGLREERDKIVKERWKNQHDAVLRIWEWKLEQKARLYGWRPPDAHPDDNSPSSTESESKAEADLSSVPSTPIYRPQTVRTGIRFEIFSHVGYEMQIRALHLRVSAALRSDRLSEADTLISEALATAEKLNYRPTTAKCKYWEGILRHSQGRHEDAARAIALAQCCGGQYTEGKDAPKWLDKYQDVISRLGLKVDFEPFVTRERPREYDLPGGFEDEDEDEDEKDGDNDDNENNEHGVSECFVDEYSHRTSDIERAPC